MKSNEKYDRFMAEINERMEENDLPDYHAFVYWFIESMYGLEKINILNAICDKTHDKGVDAVVIDEIERRVLVFQSKFERGGNSVQVKDSELKLLGAVKDYFKNRRSLDAITIKANQTAKRLLNQALDVIKNKNYSLELVFITTHKGSPNMLALIRDTMGFKAGDFSIYCYEDVMHLCSERLRDFTPPLGVYCLPYRQNENNLIRTEPHKAWVISVSLEEIRCMVNKYGDKLFRKNVRNFLGKNRCNKKIVETLEKDKKNFWYYNNGICILCDEANIVVENKYVRLVNPQIINGCQTVRSIESYNGDVSGEILVRVIESKDYEFMNALTLYQNTSNPVKKRDLKSNDPIQIRLKYEFKRKHYYYEIKRGEDYETMLKKYPAMKQYYSNGVINNEILAKLLATIKIGPALAASKGSEAFFDDYYDSLFETDTNTSDCLTLFNIFDEIKNEYKGSNKSFYTFENEWVFKSRAAFHVLKFICASLGNLNKWSIDFNHAYETNKKGHKKFSAELHKAISKYFKIIYKSWKASGEEYYNTFLQNSSSEEHIRKKFRREFNELHKKINSIFNKFID